MRHHPFAGVYDAVRRYGRRWQRARNVRLVETYVPLVYAPGEAYQFDWSHEVVVLAGVCDGSPVGAR